MKYFGRKSLSSLLCGFFRVSWYVVLVLSIISAVAGVIILFAIPLGDPFTAEFAKNNFHFSGMDYKNTDCGNIHNWPLALKIILILYFGAIVVLMLKILKKAQHLFSNFKNDILFNKSNVRIISKISKLNIVLSILTFSFGSLLISVFLFMLCEIIKNGAVLQEEHDLTV
jgi:hypothetical protein